MPTLGCKDTNFPSKKERNRQLFPFKKESYLFLSNPCGFSYMHNRREYLSGKANNQIGSLLSEIRKKENISFKNGAFFGFYLYLCPVV